MADIEQLWYTFSANGLTGTTRGSRYQVRAASAGLLDSNSERMIMLNRYLRYEVHTYLRNNASLTPICLCFLIIEQGERVLAQKIYTGEGNKRHPFIHLLAGLPSSFTVRDAILLWRSDFWQMVDVDIKHQGLRLPVLALEQVKQQGSREKFRQIDTIHIQSQLPSLLYAVLVLLLHPETIYTQNIYIAAPFDEIAYFVLVLAHCLPAHVLENFTFSTYEYDVLRNRSLLVGICKADGEKQRTIRDPLPEQCYVQGLAFNSYAGRLSRFDQMPSVDDILDYVIRALDAWEPAEGAAFLADLDSIAATQSIDALLEAIRACQQQHPLNKAHATESEVGVEASTQAAFSEMLQNPHLAVEHLSQQTGRRAFLEVLIAERSWFYTTLKPQIARLLKESKHDAELGQVVALLIQDSMEMAVHAVSEQKSGTFMLLFHLMEICALPTRDSEVWLAFFQYLQSVPGVSAWIKQHWNIQEALLLTAIKVIATQESAYIAFLLIIPWSHLGKFLALPAPKKWRVQAIQALVSGQAVASDADSVKQLSQQYGESLEALFYQLTLESSELSLAVALFLQMASGGYSNNVLLHMLFDQDITQSDANRLLNVPGLTPQQRGLLQRAYIHKRQNRLDKPS